MYRLYFREQFEQFLYVLYTLADSIRFARKNRIWEGFMAYGWAARLMVFIGVLAGLKFVHILWKYLNKVEDNNPFAAMSMLGSFAQEVATAEYEFLFAGGMKYGTLILLEILIFHITFRTLSVLLVKSGTPTLKDFIRAQIRMFKISIVCLILDSIIGSAARQAVDLLPLVGWMAPAVGFAIQSIFMGIPVIDNFNEQFDMGIKPSLYYSKQFIGVALGLGLMLQLFFLIPVAGNILGPILVSITSALVMYELSDMTRRKEASLTLEEELV